MYGITDIKEGFKKAFVKGEILNESKADEEYVGINPITGGVSEHPITGGVMQFCITLDISKTTNDKC